MLSSLGGLPCHVRPTLPPSTAWITFIVYHPGGYSSGRKSDCKVLVVLC